MAYQEAAKWRAEAKAAADKSPAKSSDESSDESSDKSSAEAAAADPQSNSPSGESPYGERLGGGSPREDAYAQSNVSFEWHDADGDGMLDIAELREYMLPAMHANYVEEESLV